MAGFWGKRKREEEAALAAQDADLARRARTSLVAADERVRLTADELDFAEAELGTGPTKELREALTAVRTHLSEAFHLNQLNHDEIPDTTEELRTRNARIIQLCEWAESLLEERTAALAKPIELARRAPQIIAGVRADATRLRDRLPVAVETLSRLQERYTDEALRKISSNPAEAEQLLGFAEHSAGISERRRDAGQREQANLALEAATESVRRAATLVDAVETFEIEALRAESTLSAVIEDSRGDIVAAREAPQVPAVGSAVAALQDALASLPAAGAKTDPFAELTRLREANTALDAAIDAARERAARPIPSPEVVRNAIDDADRQLAVARDVIAGHRGWIGADARTRLAEAERIRGDLDRLLGAAAVTGAVAVPEDDRDEALGVARRVAFLANEALQLAQRDIDSSRPQGGPGGWGGPGGQGGQGGNSPWGGILGGLVIGSLLGDIFD
jgi:hypothetical protein